MPRALLSLILGCNLAFSTLVMAQAAPPHGTPAIPGKAIPAKGSPPPKPKLTEEQKRGLRLLKASEAEAAGLEPAMRAAVLRQAAYAYKKVDKKRAIATLKDAFNAAASAQDENHDVQCFMGREAKNCEPKYHLEEEILFGMIDFSPDDAEALLPQADPDIKVWLTSRLLSKYLEDKKMDRAENLFQQLADEKEFPYSAAADLMAAQTSGQRRLAIFNVAVKNLQAYGMESFNSDENLGTLIVRFSHDLPTPVVLEAIDLILDKAREVPNESGESHIGLTTQKGTVTFSTYQYELFALLPVLQELDSAHAESLLRENAEAKGALDKYPKGLQSLTSMYRDTPVAKDDPVEDYPFTTQGSTSDIASVQPFYEYQNQLMQTLDAIRKEEKTDPKQALADAMNLEMWGQSFMKSSSPRTSMLAEVAMTTAKDDPDTAKKALEEARKTLDQVKPEDAGRYIARIAMAYVNMGDKEQAEKTVREGFKIAEKLYAEDDDSSDPNRALKAEWPSAGLWRQMIRVSGKISAQFAEQMVAEIPDEEIRAMQKVERASVLLGGEDLSVRSMSWHKDPEKNDMREYNSVPTE